jgi:RNA polymerase sigma factor (sigma-70 family)
MTPPTPARYSMLSDDELLELSVDEPDAFGAFYDRFEEELLAFFLRATRRADVAADLTGEVFAAALSSASLFRTELGSARGWLFGIARHELADMWQRGRVEDRARRRVGLEPISLTDDALERIDELASHGSGAVLRLLEDLPDDQRAAVQGRVLHERSYDELARSLSCSESVVRQRVSRGLRSLRLRLEQAR